MTTMKTVAGKQLQVDRSGVCDWWVNIDRKDISAKIVEEIEIEILDKGVDATDCYRADDGCDYRWTSQTVCE